MLKLRWGCDNISCKMSSLAEPVELDYHLQRRIVLTAMGSWSIHTCVRAVSLNVLNGVLLGQEKGQCLANSMHLVSQIVLLLTNSLQKK